MRLNARTCAAGLAGLGMISIGTPSASAALVAHWPLNDGPAGGVVSTAAEVVNGNADNFLNAVAQTEAGGFGTWFNDPTRGIVFSTTENDRLNAGTQGIDRNVGFSWSLWANIASSNIADPAADVLIGTRSVSGGVWNKIEVGATNGDGAQNWASIGLATSISNDAWRHIAYLGDAASVRLYIDGALVGSDATTPTATFDGPLSFGGSSQFSEDVTGLMSDVAIWNQALTSDEVKGLFDVGNSGDLALYDAAQFDQLRALHGLGSGFVDIGDLRWTYATGLTGAAGLSGSAPGFTLVLNSQADTGLVSSLIQQPFPEPASGMLALAGLGGWLARRRRGGAR